MTHINEAREALNHLFVHAKESKWAKQTEVYKWRDVLAAAVAEIPTDDEKVAEFIRPLEEAVKDDAALSMRVHVLGLGLTKIAGLQAALAASQEQQAEIERLTKALESARSQLVTFGGDVRKRVQESGSADGDEIQAAVLDQIDQALSPEQGGDNG